MVQLKNGGGIRATLFTTYQRFDYNFVLTILLAIKGSARRGDDRPRVAALDPW